MPGQYLAVLTNTGVIKILDVKKPTQPKLLGSAGRVTDPKTGTSIGMGVGASTGSTTGGTAGTYGLSSV